MALKDLIQVVATLLVCFIEKRGNKHLSNKTVCTCTVRHIQKVVLLFDFVVLNKKAEKCTFLAHLASKITKHLHNCFLLLTTK